MNKKAQFKADPSTSNEEVGQVRERFALLLNGFSAVTGRGSTSVPPVTARIQTLLKQFGEHRDRADTLEQSQAVNDRHQIRALLDRCNKILEGYRQKQEHGPQS